MYVIYGCEHLQDGIEEWAKILRTKEECLEYLNQSLTGFGHACCTYKVFELGKEITAEFEMKETKVEREPEIKQQWHIKRSTQ